VTVKAVATIATVSVTPGTPTIAATALGVTATHTRVAAIAGGSGIPTCIAAVTTVVAVTAFTFEPTRVAAVAYSRARTGGVRKTISAKDSGIRTLCCTVTEKHIDARG
jgi:hypothetical protein